MQQLQLMRLCPQQLLHHHRQRPIWVQRSCLRILQMSNKIEEWTRPTKPAPPEPPRQYQCATIGWHLPLCLVDATAAADADLHLSQKRSLVYWTLNPEETSNANNLIMDMLVQWWVNRKVLYLFCSLWMELTRYFVATIWMQFWSSTGNYQHNANVIDGKGIDPLTGNSNAVVHTYIERSQSSKIGGGLAGAVDNEHKSTEQTLKKQQPPFQ